MSLPRLMFDPTTPDGVIACTVDFSTFLPEGITLSSATCTIGVHDLSAEPDDDAGDRLSGSASVDGNYVVQTFEGGLAGVDYVLTFLATLSDGEVEAVQVIQPVRKYV